MNRRNFFKNGSLFALGASIINPFDAEAREYNLPKKDKKAKNIIFIVSDGMSIGTMNMTDIFLRRKTGKGSNWYQLYRDNRISHGLMDMASASSIVTDSAAASSSWGGGFRVNNGSLNIGTKGEEYLPILQKFKRAGKMTGCVTTVPITHATPAGFCVSTKSRGSQEEIAEMYLGLKFDVMMGGGNEYFSSAGRKDKRDLYSEFSQKGFKVVKTKQEMIAATGETKPVLGVFSDDGLPYSIEMNNNKELSDAIPTLAEMTKYAIEKLEKAHNGFVLQVEAGKVDWAAHGNDIGGLIYDQIACDEAIKVAIDFAEKDQNTLVIMTTDHGNANPGIIAGSKANENFDSIQKYTQSNSNILNSLSEKTSVSQLIEIIEQANKIEINKEEATKILDYYKNIATSDGLYNARHLPFKEMAELQRNHNSVSWISNNHSADFSETAMFGPGSHLLKPFINNTDMHNIMLQAAEVENKF